MAMEWTSDPHYSSLTSTSTTEVAPWSKQGSAAAAALFLLGTIDEVECGSDILREMRSLPLIQHIIRLIKQEVAIFTSGEVPQGNTNPEDFKYDVEDDDDDDDPNNQFHEGRIRQNLTGKSLGGLVKVLLLQIYWHTSAMFSTTYVGTAPLVKSQGLWI